MTQKERAWEWDSGTGCGVCVNGSLGSPREAKVGDCSKGLDKEGKSRVTHSQVPKTKGRTER